jgi:GT2 family glycosyltransferase/peptidoglycan/xylan/chitin deacetylase (PgdA/CDA1 family)
VKSPSFSIVIPTYQRREIVSDALRALCKVDYDGLLEIIIVVDGSTDGTEAAVTAIPCPHPKKVIAQRNAGLAGARNRGAAEARGEIILFLDDDMMATPNLLREHARSHAEGADAVMGDIPLDPNSPPGFLATGVQNWAHMRAGRFKRGETPTLFDLVCGHLSIRRDVFEAVGGFDESFTAGGTFGDEDVDFAIRLTDTYQVRFNPDAIACQRYVVTPRQNLRQWAQAGRSDVLFARKHPERTGELFELHGRNRWITRFALRPLAAVPALPDAIAGIAIALAEREAGLPPILRRAVAKLFAVARDIVYWRGVRRAGGIPLSERVLVLCYHAVADLSGDPVLSEYGIDPDTFAAQLDRLSRRGFTFISPDEFERLVTGRGRVPKRAALLTFDDCYEELTGVARDILEVRQIQGIAFAVSGMETGTNEWDQKIGAGRLRLLDPAGLRELGSRHVEVGCHSKSHRPLPKLSDSALAEETRGAADQIASLGLPRPRFFAYPHGANDERSRAAARAAGFTAAFALVPSRGSPRNDRFAVPRVEIFARDRSWRFWLKTEWPQFSAMLLPVPMHIRAYRRIGRIFSRLTAGPAG